MLIVVGTNHKYSPIEIREESAFSKKRLNEALVNLIGYKGINAGVILSTCNRVELYASAQDAEIGIKELKKFISEYHEISLDKIGPYLYTYMGKEAIRHLFQVACGLDSQIVGEAQILKQVEFAWHEARRYDALDSFLDKVFNKAVIVSLKVRRKTGISAGDISIASVALELMKTRFIDIKEKKILIIGVGKISELVLRHLKNEGVKTVFIANKTFEKAKRLAGSINAEVVRFDQLERKLREADVVITATASPHFILRREDITDIVGRLLIIDLAVPRNVEPCVKDIEGVSLFNLDDLTPLIEKKINRRKQEIPKAQGIINKEVKELCSAGPLELEPEEALLR